MYETNRQEYGEGDYRTIKSKFWCGRVLMLKKKNSEALELLDSVYPHFVRVLGQDHDETLIVKHFIDNSSEPGSMCLLV